MATNRFGPAPLTVPAGTTTVGGANGVAVPDATTAIIFRIAPWPQANRSLSVKYFQSTDGGGSWADAGGQNPWPGNPSPPVGRDGTTDSTAVFNVGAGVNRRVRLDVTAAGGSVSTMVTVQTEP